MVRGWADADHYYNYGPTPADATPHWYDFLFNQKTDGDSATGTGMANSGNLTLHFIEGGRGDDDLAINNDVHGIGGPANQLNGATLPPGDANHDGIVNMQDIAVISARWLQTGANNPGDINGDGIVNSQDLALISSKWLATIAPSNGGNAMLLASGESQIVPTTTFPSTAGSSTPPSNANVPIARNVISEARSEPTLSPAAESARIDVGRLLATPSDSVPITASLSSSATIAGSLPPHAVDRIVSTAGEPIAAAVHPASLDRLMAVSLDDADLEIPALWNHLEQDRLTDALSSVIDAWHPRKSWLFR